jgi:hypothetical protein
MSKMVRIAVLALTILFAFGCSEDVIQEGERFEVNLDNAQQNNAAGIGVLNPGEVDLIEQMAMYRSSYHRGLKNLVKYYTQSGNTSKLSWAKSELRSFDRMNKYKYYPEAEIAGRNLKATDLIIEADDLFIEVERLYKEATAVAFLINERKLGLALSKANTIISEYPTSDKIDDAAYVAGRIHDHFKDYKIAATCYIRTFQWNEETRRPARSRAAYVLDKRLNQQDQALELYKAVCLYETEISQGNVKFAKKRILELTESDLKLDNDKTAIPDDKTTEDIDPIVES